MSVFDLAKLYECIRVVDTCVANVVFQIGGLLYKAIIYDSTGAFLYWQCVYENAAALATQSE